MEARGRPDNIQKEPPREIISTTGKQHGNIKHATGKIKYDVDGTFLYSLNLLTLVFCERIMSDRDTIF